MIGDVEGGVSPFKIFGKRRKGGTKVKRKATKTAKRRGGFSKSTKSKNIPGFNRQTRFSYKPRAGSPAPTSPSPPVVTSVGPGGQPVINIDISDLVDLNVANAVSTGSPSPFEEVIEEETITTENKEMSGITSIEQYYDKYKKLPKYEEVWKYNLTYKDYGKTRDRFDTFEDYVRAANADWKGGRVESISELGERSKGSFKETKSESSSSSTTTRSKRTIKGGNNNNNKDNKITINQKIKNNNNGI
tara:strand:+ start:1250 stop:1987 length:738 start_codon:yes stop_codon:yes gene_type:complete